MAEAHSDDEWSQARESRPGCKGRRGRDGRDAWGAGLVGRTEEQVCAAGGGGRPGPASEVAFRAHILVLPLCNFGN